MATRIDQPAQVAGLPQFLLAATAAAAKQHGVADATAENGPWHIGLDMSVAAAFLSHAQDRSLREQLYRQLVARAAPGRSLTTRLLSRNYDNNVLF